MTYRTVGLVLCVILAILMVACSGNSGERVTSFTLTPSVQTPPAGSQVEITVNAQFANGTSGTLPNSLLTWASSNAGVATVDANGLVTTHKAGPFTLTATHNGISATLNIVVGPPMLGSITISPTNPSVPLGNNIQFIASGKLTDGTDAPADYPYIWSSSDTTVATINSATGQAVTVKQGTTTISVASLNVTKTTLLTVTAPAPAALTLNTGSVTVAVDATQQLTATVRMTDNSTQNVTSQASWTVADGTVASVAAGLVTGLKAGSTKVTATYDQVSIQADVTVTSGASAGSADGFVYMLSKQGSWVTGVRTHATDSPTLIDGSPMAVMNETSRMAISPLNGRAYFIFERPETTYRGVIWGQLDPDTGRLTMTKSTMYTERYEIGNLAIHPNGKFLYTMEAVSDGSIAIQPWSLDANGVPSMNDTDATLLDSAAVIDSKLLFDSTGTRAYATGSRGLWDAYFFAFNVDTETGRLTLIQSVPPASRTHPGGMCIDSANKNLVLGSYDTNNSAPKIEVWQINSDGTATAKSETDMGADAVGSIRCAGDRVFAIVGNSIRIGTVQDGVITWKFTLNDAYAADIAVTPEGDYLYSVKNQDPKANMFVTYSVDSTTLALTKANQMELPTEIEHVNLVYVPAPPIAN